MIIRVNFNEENQLLPKKWLIIWSEKSYMYDKKIYMNDDTWMIWWVDDVLGVSFTHYIAIGRFLNKNHWFFLELR